jgi:hypothetical protein
MYILLLQAFLYADYIPGRLPSFSMEREQGQWAPNSLAGMYKHMLEAHDQAHTWADRTKRMDAFV